MKINYHFLAICVFILLLPNVNFSQTVKLGILESFEGYTGAGAITNGSGASWKGDAGTNIGIISGFSGPANFSGNTYNANATTAQCRVDLFRLYIHLNDLFVDYPSTHVPAFGGGETLSPGVYSIPGAGSIGASLTLDGGNNPDAFFIIKFYGAMTVGAGATVNLTNGTKSCNVFFIADGAISVAADAKIKGTLFAKIGAVGLGANAVLEGRMFSLQGALVTGVGAVVSPPPCKSTIPVFCESNCSPAPAVDVLGVLSNYALYTSLGAVANTSTSGIDGNMGTASGAVSGFEDSIVVGEVNIANASTAQADIDLDNAYNALMALPNTVPSDAGVLPVVSVAHPAAFGAVGTVGETLKSGVYFIAGAGSLGGTLTLDGQNDPNSIFVFKFAGAFSVGAQSKIILINGARRCNVFWIGGAGVATGAITIGAGSVLKGTFLSHGGACGSGASVFLGGRQLSTGGAVNTYSGIIYNNPVCITSTPLSAPAIVAVVDTTTPINGLTGGTTSIALTSNDTLGGLAVVIGTTPGKVSLKGITVPVGLLLNANGTVTIAANTSAGNYKITYQICEVDNPSNCSSVTSTIVVVAPAIALIKSAVIGGTGTGLLSEVITYTFKVTNIGDTNLTNTTITDPMVGLTIIGNPIASLTTTASNSSIKGTYTITQADIDSGSITNSALATAKDPSGSDITDISGTSNDDDDATVTNLKYTPAVALVKTASVGGTGKIGDIITYTFTITNVGNTTLSGIIVTDPMVGLTITGNPIPSLTVSASNSTIKGSYIITQADIDAGSITNSALATAKDPKGNNVTDISGTSNDDDNPTETPTTATIIKAITDTTDPVNGLIGGTTTTILTSNDTLNGNPVVIGSASGNIIINGVTVPTGLTLNVNGTVSIAPNTPAGNYSLTYKICEVSDTANCSTTTSTIVVAAPKIVAVADSAGPINGSLGKTNAINVLTNDTLNGSAITISQVHLTTVTPNTNLTLNEDGSIDVAPDTPSGTYNLTYQICEKQNPTNCSQAAVAIEVIRALPDFTPTIDIDDLLFLLEGDSKDFVINISEIKGAPSDGQVIIKIAKQSAFTISFIATSVTASVNGGVTINNSNWLLTEDLLFVTLTLKIGVVIPKNTFSAIGFTLVRKLDVPAQTSQPITVTVLNGSGLDSQSYNNTYNTIVKAQ